MRPVKLYALVVMVCLLADIRIASGRTPVRGGPNDDLLAQDDDSDSDSNPTTDAPEITTAAPDYNENEAELLCGEYVHWKGLSMGALAGKKEVQEVSNEIVGGDLVYPGQFPHQARVSFNGTFVCGAVLIDERHLLTAAHCIRQPEKPKLYNVTLGDLSISQKEPNEVEMRIEAIKVHDNYRATLRGHLKNDIALLRLAKRVNFTLDVTSSAINRVCLPRSSLTKYRVGQRVLLSGWGSTGINADFSDWLQHISLRVINPLECKKFRIFCPISIKSTVCAGDLEGSPRGPYSGDSGGPLVRIVKGRYELVGIVSTGPSNLEGPSTYTRVSFFVRWIKFLVENPDKWDSPVPPFAIPS